MDIMDSLTCSVCFSTYDEDELMPVMLNCGHSFCMSCMMCLMNNYTEDQLVCPKCREKIEIEIIWYINILNFSRF